MDAVTLIFPNQLFRNHPAVCNSRPVYLVEEELFFNQYHFHKQKLVLHRATMKIYREHLRQKNIQVYYVEGTDTCCDIRKLISELGEQGIKALHYADPVDDWLEKRITKQSALLNIKTVVYPSPAFLNTLPEVSEFFDKKKTYFQTDFYIWQRKQRRLLLDGGKRPEGGRWTFDSDNRQKYPRNQAPPAVTFPRVDARVTEARAYVAKNYKDNYGLLVPPYYDSEGMEGFYPVDFDEADRWLEDFLSQRLQQFGIYQDAIVGKEHFLHHGVLTPMLNTGLLTPQQVVDKAIAGAAACGVPMNSLEGFLRQVIGWREFIRIVYAREGGKQRTKNFWGFTRKIPPSFWKGETGIVPVDTVITKLLQTAYSHHIERLMVMANFMLLCEFDPDEVYQWFMELYIDSYDWVMVPNVYGMTQFADGGLMATKPYISSSNYIMKMSDFKKGAWQQVWDGLFWRFMHVNRSFFSQNQRLSMLLKTFDKMPPDKQKLHLSSADGFLANLDTASVSSPRLF